MPLRPVDQVRAGPVRRGGTVRETEFVDGAGFTDAKFSGQAQFIRTSFNDVSGFVRACFGGETRFDHVRFGALVSFTGSGFSRPPRINAVWVRLDGRKLRNDSTWPPGTVIRETGARPDGVHEGRWGLLVPAPPDETAAK